MAGNCFLFSHRSFAINCSRGDGEYFYSFYDMLPLYGDTLLHNYKSSVTSWRNNIHVQLVNLWLISVPSPAPIKHSRYISTELQCMYLYLAIYIVPYKRTSWKHLWHYILVMLYLSHAKKQGSHRKKLISWRKIGAQRLECFLILLKIALWVYVRTSDLVMWLKILAWLNRCFIKIELPKIVTWLKYWVY